MFNKPGNLILSGVCCGKLSVITGERRLLKLLLNKFWINSRLHVKEFSTVGAVVFGDTFREAMELHQAHEE